MEKEVKKPETDEIDEEMLEDLEELNLEEDDDNSEEEDFEYDEDGNIIIPENDEDEEDNEEETEKQEEQEEKDEIKQETDDEGSEKVEKVVEPDLNAKLAEKDKYIAELERKVREHEYQGKETLKKLGVESDNVIEGLEKVAAEADGMSLEDYKKGKAENFKNTEAAAFLQKIKFEEKMKADLAEIQSAYPETKNISHIKDIENFAEFGRLRDLGLTAKQAYAAVNADSVRKNIVQNTADAVKQQSLNQTKNHLKTAVPKNSKDDSLVMPKKTLVEWRELFPNKSDREIVALYKQSYSK